VARTRPIAIAALAASALIFTPGAANAQDGLHSSTTSLMRPELVEGPSTSSGDMSSSGKSGTGWAHYRGYLTDLSPSTDGVFDGARASVVMIGLEGGSSFRLQIAGIDEHAVGKQFPTRLHKGPCVAGQGSMASGPYNTQEESGFPAPWAVNNQTEVHLDFKVNSDRTAQVSANVPFVPAPGRRSIVIHTDTRPPAGSSSARLACLPLDIRSLAGAGR
jgi:superoxide dismutase, Cu-Zn family